MENIQRRISALLERAAHPATPEAERAACQEKADGLMFQHKIDRANLSWEKPVEERRKPVTVYMEPVRLIDYNGFASQRDSIEYTIQSIVSGIQGRCVRFAGVKARSKYFTEDQKPEGMEGYGSKIVVVGYEEDIYYGQLVWNMAFQEILRSLYPGWSAKLSMDANVYNLKEAGYSWSAIRNIGIANGAKDGYGELTEKNAGSKLRTAYKREAKRRGLPAELPKLKDPHHWRHSFISGFESNLVQRMTAIKAGREDYFGSIKNLPAIQQDENAVTSLFEEHFPPPPPLTEEELAEQAKAEEERIKRPRKAVKVRSPRDADSSAWASGVYASDRIDLGNTAKVQNKKEIVQ